MSLDFKYFGNVNIQQNTISNVIIGDKTSSQLPSTIKHELFFIDGDLSNVYTHDGNKVIKVGSALRISELKEANANISMGGHSFSNVAYPSQNGDVATKGFVLDVAFGNVAGFDLQTANVDFDGDTYAIDPELSYDENMRIIDDAIFSIIPRPPLMSESVEESNTPTYMAKLPTGLASAWYTDASANDTITGYTTNSTLRTYFDYLSGVTSQIKSYGNLALNINGTEQANVISLKDGETNFNFETLRLDANVIITNNTYSNYWNNSNVRTDITFSAEGYSNITYISNKSGTSTERKYYYDDTATAPSFSVSPTNSVNTSNIKYLSNVAYYANTSSFDLSFTAASGIFEKAYHPSAVALVSMTSNAVTQFGVNPSSSPAVTDTFVVTNELVTINKLGVSSGQSNGSIIVTLQKPDGQTTFSSTDIGGKINTYGNVSTDTVEYFLDEKYRLEANILADVSWSSLGSFDSANSGVDAQVRNGFLKYPVTGDYQADYSPTGVKEYHRRFYPGQPVSSGYFAFDGVDIDSITPYGTGSLNAVIYLTDAEKYFDMGKDVCFSCDGDSLANAYPAREAEFESNVINYTLETFSTGTESTDSLRLILYFRDSVETVSKITHFTEYNES